MNGKPTDNLIALVAFLRGGEWHYADEIRHAISQLGFRMPTMQWISERLIAMTQEECPRFERTAGAHGIWVYRPTHWAETGLSNQFPGFMIIERAEQQTSRERG